MRAILLASATAASLGGLRFSSSASHMWTAPCLQEPAQSFDRIACSHMSGLLVRSPLTAGRDGFRDASSEHGSGTGIPLGTTDCLAFWIDRSHHLLVLEQAAASAGGGLSLPADLVRPPPCPSRPRRHGRDCSVVRLPLPDALPISFCWPAPRRRAW